ncbi:MAG: aldo/keto reductase [Bdellovibrionaceae bacterium]|nr:aldo/keto reductase [Pseudobdellovibrionaceae bacterium]
MEKRQLGSSDLQVAPWAFGGNVFGWTIGKEESFRLLDAFVGEGFNLIDTADVYSAWVPGNKGGESETIIGEWMKSRGTRDRVVLATKVGMDFAPDRKGGLSKTHIFKAVEDSLKRLQTDRIDLYMAHRDDPSVPLEETLGAFSELVRQGKIRHIGASNYTADRLVEALKVSERHGYSRFVSLEPLYNLMDRTDFEKNLLPVCREYQLGVIPYYALASGFLSGKYRTQADLAKSSRAHSVGNYMNERGMRTLKALDEVAGATKATPSQVAVAWLRMQPTITAPIASVTNLQQFEDVMKAAKLELSPEMLKTLELATRENA